MEAASSSAVLVTLRGHAGAPPRALHHDRRAGRPRHQQLQLRHRRPGSDVTAYLTCYLRLTFGQNDLPDGLLSDSATYPAAYLGPRGARGAASRSARAAGQSTASAPWMSGAGAIAGAAPPLLQLAWRRQAVIKTISSPRVLASAQSSVRFGEPNGLPRGPTTCPTTYNRRQRLKNGLLLSLRPTPGGKLIQGASGGFAGSLGEPLVTD